MVEPVPPDPIDGHMVARALPTDSDAVGPSCDADYFTGAPRVEACNATGDGWGGPPSQRLKMRCPVTKNDFEMWSSWCRKGIWK